MKKKAKAALPAGLARGRKRFERWRATRQTRRIPESLWKLAESLGAEFGIHRTSRALRLNYEELKKRVTSSGWEDGKRRPRVVGSGERSSGFVPLTPPGIGVGDGSAEYKKPDGSWMRVEWRGRAPELGALSESFFFGGRSCSK